MSRRRSTRSKSIVDGSQEMMMRFRRHEEILRAVSTSAVMLLRAPAAEPLLADVLRLVASASGASRAHLFKMETPATGPVCATEVHRWEAPGFAVPPERERVEQEDMRSVGIGSWLPRLAAGEIVAGKVRDFEEPERGFLARQGALAIVVVPIFVNDKWWGQIGLDDCETEREWTSGEIDTFKTLAELIGASLAREKRLADLADANRIVENSPTVLFRFGPSRSVPLLYISDNIRRYGYSPEELLSEPTRWPQIIHIDPDDLREIWAAFERVIDGKTNHERREYRHLKADGSLVWFDGLLTAVRDSEHRLIALEGLAVDITQRKEADAQIAALIRTDSLTTLPNRAAFLERLDQVFAAAQRDGGLFAVLYLDLDYFKDINDSLGHPMGDTLLRLVAERLRSNMREADIIARLGGDEFVVLQTGVTDPSDAGTLAAKISKVLADPYELTGNTMHITVSIGISLFSSAIAGPDEMLKQADLALYRAKDAGRNQYAFHTEELDLLVRERVFLAADIRNALSAGNQFELLYQPEVEIASGHIIGLEALVRWNHPERGLLLPETFIGVAEKTGTIQLLGHWVLEEVCRQIRFWRDEGIVPPVIALNLSVVQLRHGPDFERDVLATTAKWGLTPSDLEFEITESVLMETTREHRQQLQHLRQQGARIALDDFGIGYSSLDYLRNHPIDRLKVAQQFVGGLPGNAGDTAIVRAILALTVEFGIEAIAEGIESAEQADFLASCGCRQAQGFYFSRPVPALYAAVLLRQGWTRPSTKVGP